VGVFMFPEYRDLITVTDRCNGATRDRKYGAT